MKLSDLKKKRANKKDGEAGNPALRNKRLLIELALKLILLFMVAIAIIYGIGAAIFGSSLIIPRSAEGVLDSTSSPPAYRWTSESLRDLKIHDHGEQQAANRIATVNVSENRFSALTFGVSRLPVAYVSDGKKTIQMTEADTSDATDRRDATLLTDSCAAIGMPKTPGSEDDEAIPAELLSMPSAEMIQAANPEIITDKGTFLGQRAWVIGFEPTPDLIKRLLWVPFLEKAMQNESFALDRRWILGDREMEAIDNGDYEPLEQDGQPWSFVWVGRDSRRISQFDLRFRIDLGNGSSSEYRIFSHIFLDDKETSTSEINLGETKPLDCRG